MRGDGSYGALNTSFGRVQSEHVLALADIRLVL